MNIKYFIRTTGERKLDESISRELGEDYTLLVDYEHNSGKAYLEQLLIINDYPSVFMEDDIILCKDFKKRIEEIINRNSDMIINFFTFPMDYIRTTVANFHCYNQCCYFPQGLPKQLHDTIINKNLFHRRQEVMLREALFRMKIKTLVYRPCLVQHIDDGSLMGHDNVKFCRRSPYFSDYLDELGITYKEAETAENRKRLINLMKEKFKNIDNKKGGARTKVRLAFCLPTCEPDMMLKFLAPSIHLLKDIKDIVEFCICFQPPYTNEEIKKTLSYFEGFNVKWFYKDYNYKDGKIPLIKMRNDCAMLEPDTDYYALLDDDMQFKEGLSEFYLNAIKDFDENPSLGVVGFTSFKRGYDNYFGTDKGIIYRGGKFYGFEGLVPEKLMKNCKTLVPYENENLLELVGGQQDKFCAMIRLATGQISKQYDRVPCTHQENRHYRGARQFGWLNIEYEPNSVTSFIRKYFRKDFYSKNSNVLFEDSLLYRIYTVMTLDGTKRVPTTEHSTVRNEKTIPIVSRKGKLSFTFRMLETGDFKEFTVMQIHSLDTRPAKPIIRICIIDKIVCITYKDSENINHYTKIDNFELNTDYTIDMEVNEDVISIQHGKWKYPNWAKEMNFRYGLYTQTENGNYKMLVKNVFKGD